MWSDWEPVQPEGDMPVEKVKVQEKKSEKKVSFKAKSEIIKEKAKEDKEVMNVSFYC